MMDVASTCSCSFKRNLAPASYKSPAAKRFKHGHETMQAQHAPWMMNDDLFGFKQRDESTERLTANNCFFGLKRREEYEYLPTAKRLKHGHPEEQLEEESFGADQLMQFEGSDLEEPHLPLEEDDILEQIFEFMDSISLQRYRAVSKLWKNGCERALAHRQLVDPSRSVSSWKDIPRLVFNARFRLNGIFGSRDYFPRAWHDDSVPTSRDIQIEICGLSWKGSRRSLHLTNAFSNHLVNFITRNLNCMDGDYHDLRILVERGRVFLKLDEHWLPGTIPVRELAKVLGICRWKGLPFANEEDGLELMDE